MTTPPTRRQIDEMTRVQSDSWAANNATISDEDLALNMLAMMFDRYEDGTPCYEDPEEHSGYLGTAVDLSHDEFHAIADLLNRRRPALSMAGKPAPSAGTCITPSQGAEDEQ